MRVVIAVEDQRGHVEELSLDPPTQLALASD
jgi:hypothetical protein